MGTQIIQKSVIKRKVLLIFFIMLIFFLSCFLHLNISISAPESFFVAEGLFVNGKINKAFDYYQSAYVELQMEKDDQALKKVLERLISISMEQKKTSLCKSYEKALNRFFPNEKKIFFEHSTSKSSIKSNKKNFTLNLKKDRQNENEFEKSDLKVKIKIYYGTYRPKEIKRFLNVNEKNELLDAPDSFIEQLVEQEKQIYANSKGYPIEKYGKKNYLMVTITHVTYKIYEESWGRVLYTDENEDE